MDKEKIWKEIFDDAQEEKKTSTKRPDEMSISEFAEQIGVSRTTAGRFLDERVQRGELEMRMIQANGGTKVYRPTPA